MTAPIIPGAEPFSADGGPQGALVLHGFTGNPGSMRGVAEALAAAGCTVDLPLLPGHGTAIEDMIPTGWSDWYASAEEAYGKLRARCESVAVVGLSMGGALTLSLAADHPEIAGIVVINAVVTAPEGMAEGVQALLDSGEEVMDGIGSDIADPDSVELAYPQTPLRPLLTMFEAAQTFEGRLADIRCPVLVMTSPQDHVVEPVNSDIIAAGVAGPVERVTLERSYHVATQDFDKDLVNEKAVAFVTRVTATPPLKRVWGVVGPPYDEPVTGRITTDEVAHVAALARLDLSADELETFTGQLAAVLDHAADVEALELDDVPPTAHPYPLKNVLRPDVVNASVDTAEVLAAAPAVEDGRFRVPPILGDAP